MQTLLRMLQIISLGISLMTPGLQRLQNATRTKNMKPFGRAPLCQGSPRQDGKSDGVIIIWQAHCVERGSLSSAQIMMGYYGMAEAGGKRGRLAKRVIGRER